MEPKPILSLRLALLALTLYALATLTASAQTWETVDDLQYVAGHLARAYGLAVDPGGNVFVVGSAQDANLNNDHALIEKSSDGGAAWSTADDLFSASPHFAEYLGVASDAVGNLYACGLYIPDTLRLWTVRRSADGGTTWTTVDLSLYGDVNSMATDSAGNVYVAGIDRTSGVWTVRKGINGGTSWSTVDFLTNSSQANAVFCHPTAGVFVGGYASYPTKNGSASLWTVRRSLDGGATWTIVDNSLSGYYGARAIGADASGNIYVAGSSGGHWILRESSNGGTSWTTVDDFINCVTTTNSTKPYKVSTTCYSAYANGFAKDSHGNLFVVGYMNSPIGPQWAVRENAGGNTTWQTVDTFQYPSGTNSAAYAYAVAPDALGNVYVAGYGNDASGVAHWIVRKN